MENPNEKLTEHLNHLITICEDGKYGYETAAKDADQPELKAIFLSYSVDREEFALALKMEVRQAGGDPDRGGGPLGAIHRAWIDVKSALSSKDNKAVLDACITGEKAAVSAYDKVLNDPDDVLTASVRDLVTKQYIRIKEALLKIEQLHHEVNT